MSEHEHAHATDDPSHPHDAPLSDVQLRVRALESLLVDKGLVDPTAMDELVDTYEKRVGPRNGAQVVARAWVDPDFKRSLLEDATTTLVDMGFIGRQGEDMLAMGAWRRWNLDMSRFVKEQMPPAEYLSSSYYEKHLYGLEWLLVEKEVVTSDELQHGARERRELQPGALRREDVTRVVMSRQGGARLEDLVEPRFQVSQQVRARNTHPVGYTRLPRYVRGRRGTIDRDHGVFVFPDAHAVNGDTKPQHVYSVRFSAQELWGPEAPVRESVYVDL